MENHWPKAGKVVDEVKNLCKRVKEHNKNVDELEQLILKDIRKLSEDKIVVKLRGIDPKYFDKFMGYLLSEITREIIEKEKMFRSLKYDDIVHTKAYQDMSHDVKVDSQGLLLVIGQPIGRVDEGDWKNYGITLVADIICEVFEKYSSRLDRLTENGRKLEKEAKNLIEELKGELNNVASAKFLPISKVRKYLG